MAYTLAVMPSPVSTPASKLTLYNLEDHLTALVNSTELVEAEQEQQFMAELERAMVAAKDKRDHVAAFIAQCEGQAAMAKAEQERLRSRQRFFESAAERMQAYVLRVILQQPLDAKNKPPKLVGNTSSFEAKRNPPSVAIADEAAVPASCKTISVTMPLEMWEQICDSLEMEFAGQVIEAVGRPGVSVVKAAVKDAIVAAVPDWKEQLKERPSVFCDSVPGAAIAAGEWRLVRT